MKSAKTKQVAVCCDWPLETGCEILRGIHEFTLSHPGWDMLHMFSFEGRTVESNPRPHGIISSVSNKDLRTTFGNTRCPIVGLSILPERADTWIRINPLAVGRQAAEHLLARAFRHFGYLSIIHPDSADREEGFRQGVTASGGELSVCRYKLYRTSVVNRWLQSLKKPSGVFCFNDYTARDLLISCQACGVRVPEEIAIIGADNEALWCEMSWLQITSVAVPWRRFGYEAAAALSRLMAGEPPPIRKVVEIEPIGVIARQSTDSLAIPDQKLARVLAYLREHACDGLTLDNLLRDQSVSVRWLHSKCSRHLGHGPHEEILRIQIERAKTLLSHTALQIKEIAWQVGLSRAHFTDTFTQVVGATPSVYRQDNRR